MGEEEKEEEGEGRAGAGRLRAWRSCIIQQLNIRPASFLGVGVCSKLCLWDSPGAAAAELSASSSSPPSRARTPEASFGDVRAEAPRLSGTKAGRDLPAGLRLQSCKLGTHPSDPGPTAAAARPDSALLRAQVVPAGARPRTTHSRAPGPSGFRGRDEELARVETYLGRGWGGGLTALESCDLFFVINNSARSRVQLPTPPPSAPATSAFPAPLSNFFLLQESCIILEDQRGPLPHPASPTAGSLGSRGGHLSLFSPFSLRIPSSDFK